MQISHSNTSDLFLWIFSGMLN